MCFNLSINIICLETTRQAAHKHESFACSPRRCARARAGLGRAGQGRAARGGQLIGSCLWGEGCLLVLTLRTYKARKQGHIHL